MQGGQLPHPQNSLRTILPPEPVTLASWARTDPLPLFSHVIGDGRFTRTQWIAGARARKNAYASHHSHSLTYPVRWVLVENHESIPDDALQTGSEPSGEQLFSVRAWFNGGLHLGMGGRHLNPGAYISFGSRELPISCYEILVGDPSRTRWLEYPPSTTLTIHSTSSQSISPLELPPLEGLADLPTLPTQSSAPTGGIQQPYEPTSNDMEPFSPIEGGFEQVVIHGEAATETQKFQRRLHVIAQASFESGMYPGKAEVGGDHCSICWGGGEAWVRNFRFLVWAPR